MQNWNEVKNRSIGLTLCAAALLASVAFPKAAYAVNVVPPAVPGNLAVLAGNEPFLVGHGVGTQNYVCLPTATGVAFKLFTPEATLLSDDEKQVTTHFFSPNPDERNTDPTLAANGVIRATWQHSRDGSSVWAFVADGDSSTDERFVAKDAVAWLLLTVKGTQLGPDGGDTLAQSTFVQRVNTAGGVAPKTGCASSADVGHLAFVPYTADYFFFRAADDRN